MVCGKEDSQYSSGHMAAIIAQISLQEKSTKIKKSVIEKGEKTCNAVGLTIHR
jgi:hypothetical protein